MTIKSKKSRNIKKMVSIMETLFCDGSVGLYHRGPVIAGNEYDGICLVGTDR